MLSEFDVVIVGGGLAGLRAASVVESAGRSTLVIERGGEVGGRLASRDVDGYVIDEGFQLINPSYPELRASGVLHGFDLRRFDAALSLKGPSGTRDLIDPRHAPLASLRSFIDRPLPLRDVAALARIMTEVNIAPVRQMMRGPDMSTRDGLRHAGVSDDTIDHVLTPFLRGTLLDDELSAPWHYTQLLLRSFTRGRPGTHPEGIAALPRAFARRLRTTVVHLRETVISVTANSVGTDRDRYAARVVIVATDPSSAHDLTGVDDPGWRSQTTWWCDVPKMEASGRLRIDVDRGFLSSALDFSSVAPERSPRGRSLVAAAANGVAHDRQVDDDVLSDVARLYDVASSDVALVSRTEVVRALPILANPLRLNRSQVLGDVVLAGDYLQTPSIQGALVSGRRAAQVALARLDH